jgi:hypothetical protein
MSSIKREQIESEYNQLTRIDKFFSHPLYVFLLIICMVVDLHMYFNGLWFGILLFMMILPGFVSVIRDGSLKKSLLYYFF